MKAPSLLSVILLALPLPMVAGDLFAIVWDTRTKKLYGLNASGRSPKSLTLDHFR